MQQLPLSEATPDEVLCRVVYRIILADYDENELCYDNPTTRLLDLALCWRSAGLHLIADELANVAIYTAQNKTIANWKTIRLAGQSARGLSAGVRGIGRKR